MIVDTRSVPEESLIETDLCIVGAGVAGITLAREFAGLPCRVCLLESGGLTPEPGAQSLAAGENVGLPYFALERAGTRRFGGSSHAWDIAIGTNRLGARLRPLDGIDFEAREWMPYSGWPFGRSDLDPFYRRAQALCAAGPFRYTMDAWGRAAPALPLNSRVRTALFQFAPRDAFTRDAAGEVLRAPNVTALLHATVVEIETDDEVLEVTRLRVACLNGRRFHVAARFFVLAAGGIEIPRLLLLSNRRHPAGLGNGYDLVGRFFMEHLHFWSGIFVPSSPGFFRQATVYQAIHPLDGVPVLAKLALAEETLRRERLLNCCVQLVPRAIFPSTLAPAPASGGTSALARRATRKVRRSVERLLDRRIEVFRLANMAEQQPNPQSRVTLAEERDPLGRRRARVDWRVGPADIRSVARCQAIVGEELRRAGLGRVVVQLDGERLPRNLHGGYHHMGTTRMHRDPRQGVVDENCRVHGLANLFVAGPSVFPTAGYANPVLTIVALALRLGDHLKGRMAGTRGNRAG